MILEHVAWWIADRLADGRSVSESGTHRPAGPPVVHNHPTRVLLAPGRCPMCDQHHWVDVLRELEPVPERSYNRRPVSISRRKV